MVQARLAAWEATGYFIIPRKEHWALIKEIQRRCKIMVVAADRANAEAEARGRAGRLRAKAAAHVALFESRAVNRDKHMAITPGIFFAELAALGPGKSLKDHSQAMRDHIRVRIHVYNIKAAALPAIGSQDAADE